MRVQRSIEEVPPQAFFVGSAIFHYLGPAFAVLLFARVDVLGFALAFCNAGLFALYIVLGDRVAKRETGGGIDGLASAMLVAAVLVTPVGAPAAAQALGDPVAIAAGIGVGITSSVIPYVCDQ